MDHTYDGAKDPRWLPCTSFGLSLQPTLIISKASPQLGEQSAAGKKVVRHLILVRISATRARKTDVASRDGDKRPCGALKT